MVNQVAPCYSKDIKSQFWSSQNHVWLPPIWFQITCWKPNQIRLQLCRPFASLQFQPWRRVQCAESDIVDETLIQKNVNMHISVPKVSTGRRDWSEHAYNVKHLQTSHHKHNPCSRSTGPVHGAFRKWHPVWRSETGIGFKHATSCKSSKTISNQRPWRVEGRTGLRGWADWDRLRHDRALLVITCSALKRGLQVPSIWRSHVELEFNWQLDTG